MFVFAMPTGILSFTIFRYSVYFAVSDDSWGVQRYRAASVRLPNNTFVNIVSSNFLNKPIVLPASPVSKYIDISIILFQ